MSANSVSPLPNGEGGGNATACSMPEHHGHRHVGGVGVPQAVAETVEPAPVVQRADMVVLVEVGDVADLRDRQAPSSWPRAAARPISSGPKRAEKSRSCASVRRWLRKTTTA